MVRYNRILNKHRDLAMIEKLRIGIAPEIENQSYFDWTNRKIEEIRAGLAGCPSISVEVKNGWTWLVINTGVLS